MHFHFIVVCSDGIYHCRVFTVFFGQFGSQQGMAQFGFLIRNLAYIV